MATFTVTTSSDVVDANDGETSLREALALANDSAGADKIVFDRALAGSTITLTGELVLSSDVTINGDTTDDGDADVTLSGGNATSLVRVEAGVTAALKSLVLTGGNSTTQAGAVFNAGNLTIDYCSITGNTATLAGFYGLSFLRPGSEYVNSDGYSAAAIFNAGTLTVRETAISDNSASAPNGANGPSGILVGLPGFDGGHAAGAILNAPGATLVLDNTLMDGGTAEAGDGGLGGSGEDQGGPGGTGGSAAQGLLNRGTVSGTAENDATGAVVTAGSGGAGGKGSIFFPPAADGAPGTASTGNLNVDSGTGTITQVALGTMDGDTVFVGPGQQFGGLGGNDSITGGDYSSIFGGAGEDTLSGGLGVSADGGLGNDMLFCNYVVDGSFSGGKGIDTINFSGLNMTGETFDLSAASFTVGTKEFSDFENVIGSEGADIIIGSKGANTLKGGGGSDALAGDRGDDVMVGGKGADTLISGSGHDVLVLSNRAADADTLTDFTSGVDSLQVSASLFRGRLEAGDLDPWRFQANDTGEAQDRNDRFIYNTSNGQLFFDSNGSDSGGARLIATFTNTSTAPVASDFEIVG